MELRETAADIDFTNQDRLAAMERRNYDRMRYTANTSYQEQAQYRKRPRRVEVKIRLRPR